MTSSLSPTRPEPHVRWREWITLRANLSWIYAGRVPASNRRGHWWPDHMGAWLIRRGRVLLRQEGEGKTVIARAGEWLVPWPGYRYQEFSDDAEILSVRFRAAWPDGKPLFDRGLSVKFPGRDFPRLETAAESLLQTATPVIPADPIQLAEATVAFEQFIAVNTAFLQWLGVFYASLCSVGVKPSRIGIHDERIIATLQKLDAMPCSEKLREARLATDAGLGVSQFVRLFRHELGETPKQYFEQRRRAYCQEMLTTSAVPIKEVAYSLGFRRLSDFSAWFKHHHGLSPRPFRQQALQATQV